MTKQQIKKYLKMLNDQLAGMGIKGEICLYGGAMMCIVFNTRPATKLLIEEFLNELRAIYDQPDKKENASV